jgi:peptidoglycan/LPS O-acetylase OafA/YrhL/lysophospholipase L1-like esterase
MSTESVYGLSMGYRPELDGLRALSVLAVIAYHADLAWIPGGFLGVEVFFVVSGFLITTLMLEERAQTGSVSLRSFWLRRARRLMPALFVMLVALAFAVATFATVHAPDFRRDVVPSLLYVSNWWQIFFVETPYFAPTDLPVLRHLWSLAVEEQWYLVWPLAFLAFRRRSARMSGMVLAIASLGIMVGTALLWLPDSEQRTNFLYLSTPTRASGLLLGAALAFVWKPWTSAQDVRRLRSIAADAAAIVAIGVIAYAMATQHVDDRSLYMWWLPATTLGSTVVIAVIVRPSISLVARVMRNPVLAAIGRRSYGLYLWHWPIFVIAEARQSVTRLAVALTLTVVINELSYLLIETPARNGVIGTWWSRRQEWSVMRAIGTTLAGAAMITAVFVVGVRVAAVEARDLSIDTSGEEVVFDLEAAIATTTVPPSVSTTVRPTPTTLPKLPRRVVIVGDSQAHSLAVNKPSGIEETFLVSNGALDGCGVYERGVGIGGNTGKFRRDFGNCAGFDKKWAASATKAKADVALVVLGAWEVLDLRVGNVQYKVGTDAADDLFTAQLAKGVRAVRSTGASVALLEVPCMRPLESSGGPVPPLPQRRDDSRTQHLNTLLREFAAPEDDSVYFVTGPHEWCNNMKISTSTSYRWDGVHVYKPGAKLIFEAVASQLLQIPVKK